MTTPFPFTQGQVLTAAQMNAITTLPINDQTASYVALVGDVGKRIVMNVASANTVTINNSVFSVSDTVEVLNKGAGATTITAGAGVTLNGLSLVLSQYQGASITFLSASVALVTLTAPVPPQIAIFNETQASGVQGGAATSGSYQKRVLNTTVVNNIGGCTIATSVVTLATSGTYYLQGLIPGWRVNGFKARLQDTTAASTIALGIASNSNTTDDNQDFAFVQGIITTTISTNIELQGRVGTTSATSGVGRALAFGDNEIYAQLYIARIA